jgi:hypothetical protein
MRGVPVDLVLLGFETKSVKLELAVGRNSIYWPFQSHIVKNKFKKIVIIIIISLTAKAFRNVGLPADLFPLIWSFVLFIVNYLARPEKGQNNL